MPRGEPTTFTTANEIHLPVGVPARISLRSNDVIHSFWIPNLAGKQDLIPGRQNDIIVTPTAIGRYRGQCAEYCGLQHAHMAFDVIVESPEDFARWDAIFPRLEHPLVWSQESGNCAMLIGSTANDITGMDEDESRALLDELLAWSTQDRFTYRHQWRDGDLVIFNNPALLHRSYPYDDAAGRVMHRTTLKGREAISAEARRTAGADLYS